MDVAARALETRGTSSEPIYNMVRRIIQTYHRGRGILLDVGCGTGQLWSAVHESIDRYEGVDVVRHAGFPAQQILHVLNLDSVRTPLPDGYADIVAAVETIEHLENPRALMRELVRLCRPGGLVIVTTPNQLSLLSKLTLLLKNQFNAFTETNYPAHITALLEIDLRRIASEVGLVDCTIEYTQVGRVPGSAAKFPKFFAKLSCRGFSDNLALVGRKPLTPSA